MPPEVVDDRHAVDERAARPRRGCSRRERVPLRVSVETRNGRDQEGQRGETTSPSCSARERRSICARPARPERRAEDEQDVRRDAARQRAADDVRQSLVDGEQRDDQLGGVAERRVEEAANAGAGVLARVLGRLADQPGERNERARGDDEQHDVSRSDDPLEEEDDGRERERGPQEVPRHGVAFTPCPYVCQVLRSAAAILENRSMQADRAAAPAKLPLRPQDEVECRKMRRSLRQGGVSGDLRRAQLPLPLRLEDHGHTFVGCMQKVFDVEIDLGLLLAAEEDLGASAPSARGAGRCRCAALRSTRATARARTRSAASTPSSTRFRPSGRASASSRRSSSASAAPDRSRGYLVTRLCGHAGRGVCLRSRLHDDLERVGDEPGFSSAIACPELRALARIELDVELVIWRCPCTQTDSAAASSNGWPCVRSTTGRAPSGDGCFSSSAASCVYMVSTPESSGSAEARRNGRGCPVHEHEPRDLFGVAVLVVPDVEAADRPSAEHVRRGEFRLLEERAQLRHDLLGRRLDRLRPVLALAEPGPVVRADPRCSP